MAATLRATNPESALLELGVELHALLERIDPARFRAEQQEAMAARLLTLRRRAMHLRARLQRGAAGAPIAPDLEAALHLVEEAARVGDDAELQGPAGDAPVTTAAIAAAEPSAAAPDRRVDWAAVRARLTHAYDALGVALRARAIETPRNRPTNYLRNLYHVGNGVAILLLIELLVDRTGMIATAAAFTAFAWSAELARRAWPSINHTLMRLFGVVAHPDEHWKINSATWMCTALLLIALSAPLPVCVVAVSVLGVGDPAAALVGRRFGRNRLRGSKTVEGTLAFALAGSAAAALALAVFHPELGALARLSLAVAGAVPAALAELFSGDYRVLGRDIHLDDNFTVPVIAALFAALLAG